MVMGMLLIWFSEEIKKDKEKSDVWLGGVEGSTLSRKGWGVAFNIRIF